MAPLFQIFPSSASSATQNDLRMDPDAPNTRDMLRTFIPNEVKKCTYYRVTATGATSNLDGVIRLMEHKQYTSDWWRPKLRQCATRWGLSLQGGPSAPREITLTVRRLLRSLYGRRSRDLPFFVVL